MHIYICIMHIYMRTNTYVYIYIHLHIYTKIQQCIGFVVNDCGISSGINGFGYLVVRD